MTTIFRARRYGRFTEIKSNLRRKKLHRTNQGSNFVEANFKNRDNVRPPIQFRRDRQFMHLKRRYLQKNRPIYLHTNNTSVIRPVRQNKLTFSLFESSKYIGHSVSQIRFRISSHQVRYAAIKTQFLSLETQFFVGQFF